jgi:hypothetical protein
MIEIFPIFANHKNVFVVKYNEHEFDELERLIQLWDDSEYVYDFYFTNKSYFDDSFWTNSKQIRCVDDFLEEVEIALCQVKEIKERLKTSKISELQKLFKPLTDGQSLLLNIIPNKLKVLSFRLYALELREHRYIITGGTLKITKTMQEHPETILELNKLNKVTTFLKENILIEVKNSTLVLEI